MSGVICVLTGKLLVVIITFANHLGFFCQLAVPTAASDDDLRHISDFRTRSRFPVSSMT